MVRLARPDDAVKLWGRNLDGIPWTGFTVEVEETVVGIGGVVWLPIGPNETMEAGVFLDCAKHWLPKPLALCRYAKRVVEMALKAGESELFVVPTEGVATAKRFLEFLGFAFREMRGDVEVWSCRRSSR